MPKDRWPRDAEGLASIQGKWQEPWGDRSQDIVFIGTSTLDETLVRNRLDACQLNFTETRKGLKGWRELRDPFPSWERQDEAAA